MKGKEVSFLNRLKQLHALPLLLVKDRELSPIAGNCEEASAGEPFFLVALSGGADSVALLRALIALGYHVEAAHCNFHLRGKESDRDEMFCNNLCEELGIRLHVAHFDTIAFATLRKVSIEMAARELRYRWFSQLAKDTGAAGVCIAHHSDDQVETILLNLLRGTGIKGLLGMQRRNGIFLRPLLGVSRQEILEYLHAIGQNYVTDSTNLDDDVQRNKLRLDVIPLLEKITPAAKQNILRMADNLGDAENVVNHSVEVARKGATRHCNGGEAYALKEVLAYTSPRLLFWDILSDHSFNRTQIEEILLSCENGKDGDDDKMRSNGKMWINEKNVAIISNDVLYVYPREEWNAPLSSFRIPEVGLYILSNGKIRVSIDEKSTSFIRPSKSANIATLDSDGIVFPLTIRPVLAGDRFTPFGMKGSKLVNDYLKDKKITPLERHRQLIVTDAHGDILWLVGRTIDERWRMRATTNRVMTLSVV